MTLAKAPEAPRALQLAERLGVEIPSHITADFWSLPILEAMNDRIDRLMQSELLSLERVDRMQERIEKLEQKFWGV